MGRFVENMSLQNVRSIRWICFYFKKCIASNLYFRATIFEPEKDGSGVPWEKYSKKTIRKSCEILYADLKILVQCGFNVDWPSKQTEKSSKSKPWELSFIFTMYENVTYCIWHIMQTQIANKILIKTNIQYVSLAERFLTKYNFPNSTNW